MARLLFGGETEYALGLSGQDGRAVADARARSAGRMLTLAHQKYASLPGLSSSGLYLQNGGKFYIDTGEHPEYCTPEVSDPWTLVRYQRAGDLFVSKLAADCGAVIYKNNVDYGGTGATWGSHESYLHRTRMAALIAQLVPHLVSRVIYAGAGGFNPYAGGVEFSLSPRSLFLTEVVTERTTSGRGILNTREEPLSGRDEHRRLHLVCGESLQSELAGVLRFGTTAIILAMIEAGELEGRIPPLIQPISALRAYTSDPTLQARAECTGSQFVRALDLQHHYLSAAESLLKADFMPEWAEKLCALWREALQSLAEDPGSMKDRLDWAVKLDLYRDHAQHRGIEWSTLPDWNTVIQALQNALAKDRKLLHPDHLEKLLGDNSPIRLQVRELDSRLADRGMKWSDLRTILQLRFELFELDTRFAQIPNGIFAQLDAAGLLRHAVAEVDRIEAAMSQPPPGRPGIRGKWIGRLSSRGSDAAAEWEGVYRLDTHRYLDLGNPFIETEDRWKELRDDDWDSDEFDAIDFRMSQRSTSQVWEYYRAGYFGKAFELTETLRGRRCDADADSLSEITRLSAWLRGRLGMTDGVQLLDSLFAGQTLTLGMCSDYLQILRYNTLAPLAAMEPWIEKGRALLAAGSSDPRGVAVVFKEYSACFLSSRGQHQEALQMLGEAYDEEIGGLNDPRIRARILCDRAEVHRRVGCSDRAREQLEEAQRVQEDGGYKGDWATVNLPCRAKLENNREDSRHLLRRADSTLVRLGDPLGRIRVMLLLARFSENRLSAMRRRLSVIRLKSRLPSLEYCPVFGKIMDQWSAWVGDPAPDENGDVYWGL